MNLSGVQIEVDISGDPVTISGNWVDVSGATIITSISGQSIVTSVSGQAVTVSGNAVSVSGNVLTVLMSGGIVRTVSGNAVTVSGNTVVTSVSGNVLTVLMSGGIVRTVSGNAVFTYISGGTVSVSGNSVVTSVSGNWINISGESIVQSYTVDSVNAVGSGAITLTYTNNATPRFFEYAEYHATSGAVVSSSPLLVQHISSNSGYVINMYSLHMESSATTDVFYQPDNPMILGSGDAVKISWSNLDACAYYVRITTRV